MPVRLRYGEPLIFAGSCFTDNIAAKLREALWNVETPFGVLYNPLSINKAITGMISGSDGEARERFGKTLVTRDGKIVSYMYSSVIYGEDRKEITDRFMHLRESVSLYIRNCSTMFLTFGTSWVYALAEDPENVVANCHKQPQSTFVRYRLEPGYTADVIASLIDELRELNPSMKFVLTVSPIRHLKDGFHGNTLSKAVLHLAVEQVCGSREGVYYFPAYELLADDLRDYRFYDSDLVHPSRQGVEYIWEHFQNAFMDTDAIAELRRGEALAKRMNHRNVMGNGKSNVKGLNGEV